MDRHKELISTYGFGTAGIGIPGTFGIPGTVGIVGIVGIAGIVGITGKSGFGIGNGRFGSPGINGGKSILETSCTFDNVDCCRFLAPSTLVNVRSTTSGKMSDQKLMEAIFLELELLN